MNTEPLHKVIDSYLSQLKTDSDRLSQFYGASIIAKNALIEVDKLRKALQEIANCKTTQYAGKVSMKTIANKALEL